MTTTTRTPESTILVELLLQDGSMKRRAYIVSYDVLVEQDRGFFEEDALVRAARQFPQWPVVGVLSVEAAHINRNVVPEGELRLGALWGSRHVDGVAIDSTGTPRYLPS